MFRLARIQPTFSIQTSGPISPCAKLRLKGATPRIRRRGTIWLMVFVAIAFTCSGRDTSAAAEEKMPNDGVKVAALPAAAKVPTAKNQTVTWDDDVERAWKNSQNTKRPMLLFVTMNGCHFCTKMKEQTFTDRRVIEEINRSFVPTAVRRAQHAALVKRLAIRSYPTTVIVLPDGRVHSAIPGFATADKFHRQLRLATAKRQSGGSR